MGESSTGEKAKQDDFPSIWHYFQFYDGVIRIYLFQFYTHAYFADHCCNKSKLAAKEVVPTMNKSNSLYFRGATSAG